MAGNGWEDQLARALDAGQAVRARRLVAHLVDVRSTRDQALQLLATRAAAGSPLALELLTELVDDLGLARAAVRRVLVDEAAVEDVAQEVLIAAARSIGRFRGESSFVTWLFQIGRNRAVDYLRRQRGERDSSTTGSLDTEEWSEAYRISSLIARRQSIQELVDRLPDPYRQALRLREIDHLSYATIAERLNLNLNTVKSHVRRARAMLGGMIGENGDGWR